MWDLKEWGVPELDGNELRYLTLSTAALCGTSALFWWYYKNNCKSHDKWWSEQKKPSWGSLVSTSNRGMMLDVLSYAGIPSAIYFAYKQETDRRTAVSVALISGGALLACSLLSAPVYLHSKDLKCLCSTSMSLSITSGVLAASLYNINTAAGILMLPTFLWCTYCFLVIHEAGEIIKKQ